MKTIMIITIMLSLMTPIVSYAEDEIEPLPKDYKEQIIAYLKEALDDPDSLRGVKCGQPYLAGNDVEWPSKGLKKGKRYWNVDVSFRAKNRFGGYVKSTENVAMFVKGKIVYFYFSE